MIGKLWKHRKDLLAWVWHKRIKPKFWRFVRVPEMDWDFGHNLYAFHLWGKFINPRERDLEIADAEVVMQNVFETLGSGPIDLREMNWHKDFKSGKVWPLVPTESIDYLGLGDSSDVKMLWELSRLHQTWWLGKAFWITKDKSYAKKWQSLVEDWIEHNPIGMGVNWAVSMEVAIRACNWIVGARYFRDYLPKTFWNKFYRHLYLHGLWIEYHLEFGLPRGNHFLANVMGLVALGALFSGTRKGDIWYRWGTRQLEREMRYQVYQDGVFTEGSTAYHRYATEMFLVAAMVVRCRHNTLTQEFHVRLQKMFYFIQQMTRPDGTMAMFGDDDSGNVFKTEIGMYPHRWPMIFGEGRTKFGEVSHPDQMLGISI